MRSVKIIQTLSTVACITTDSSITILNRIYALSFEEPLGYEVYHSPALLFTLILLSLFDTRDVVSFYRCGFNNIFLLRGGLIMRKYLFFGSSLLLFAMTLFYGNAFAQNDEIAATIGDKKITVSDFNTIIGYLDSDKQKVLEKNPQLKESFLRQIVQSMVISDLAKEKGFDKKPEVKKQLELFTENFLANEFLKREVAQKVTVSEEDMKSYYEGHKDEFKTPEMVKARHILIRVAPAASEEDKKKAKEKAEDILKKIKDGGEDFSKLASDLSDDPGSKSKGGDLGFFPKGRMVKPFEDAAFSLKPGEISGIVETQFGFHIIKVEERKDASVEPLEKVKERINQKLLQERVKTKIAEFIDNAMKDAKAEIHPEVFTGEKK